MSIGFLNPRQDTPTPKKRVNDSIVLGTYSRPDGYAGDSIMSILCLVGLNHDEGYLVDVYPFGFVDCPYDDNINHFKSEIEAIDYISSHPIISKTFIGKTNN